MQRITSPQNPRLKKAVRLRGSRGRKQQSRIVIDGVRETALALSAGIDVIELYVRPPSDNETIAALIAAAESTAAEVFEVDPQVFSKLAFGDRNEGVVAVASTPRRELSEWSLPDSPLVVVLEGVEKPGNVGAVLRTADAVGVAAAILADAPIDLYNPNTIRASLGAVFTVPVFAASSIDTLAWLRKNAFRMLAARVDGAEDYSKATYRGSTAIVLGSEAGGLTEIWRGDDITPIALPMRGRIDSLNVSTSAAVLLYEALRQRDETAKS